MNVNPVLQPDYIVSISATVNCNAAPQPDYIVSISAPASATVGVPFQVSVTTSNTGPGNSPNASVTQVNFTGSTTQNIAVPPLASGASQPNTVFFTCAGTGVRTITARADATGTVGESNENNNLATAAVNCNAALRPDYVPEVSPPASAVVGVPFQLNFNTSNTGTGAAVNVSNTRLTFGSVTQNYLVNALAAGAKQAHSATLTCASAGQIQLTVTVDSNNQITNELNEANNVFSATVNCNAAPQPDYVVSIAAPASATVGVPFPFRITTRNSGTAGTSINSVTRATMVGNLVRDYAVPGLGVGLTSQNDDFFECFSAGIYTMYAQADYSAINPNGTISELNETNNGDSKEILCINPQPLPDYMPQASPPSYAYVGVPFTVQVNTTNIGAGGANASSRTWVGFGSSLQYISVSPLASGSKQTNTATFTCMSEGLTQFAVRVDADGAVNESNENNNLFTQDVQCLPPGNPPNYIAIISNAPSSVMVGISFNVNITTINNGGSDAESDSTTQVNFSGSSQNIGVRALEVSQVYTRTVSLSCTGAGIRPITAQADAFNTINESDEGDNIASVDVNCESSAPSYCELAFINHSSNLLQGDSAKVRASCFNSGGTQVDCSQLSWSHNANAVNVTPASTPIGFAPEVVLSASPTAPVPQTGRTLTAAGSGYSCFVQFSVDTDPNPVRCSLEIADHSNTFVPGDSAIVRASCFNTGGSQVSCPSFSWFQNAINSTIYPSNTSPSTNPETNLSVLANAKPQTNRMAMASSSGLGFSCIANFSISASPYEDLVISCGLRNHGLIFYPGESAIVEANCSIGKKDDEYCPTLNWSVANLTMASLNPVQTPPGESPRMSLFSISSAAPTPQNGRVEVSCANPAECSASCSIGLIGVYPPPDLMLCSLVNHSTGNLFTPNDWSYVQASCFRQNEGEAFVLEGSPKAPGGPSRTPTACPDINWFTNISQGYLEPSFTPSQFTPLTNFSTRDAPYPQRGVIDAVSANQLVRNLRCAVPLISSVGQIGPDYVVTQVKPESLLNKIGEYFKVEVRVKNIGNQNTSNTSATALLGNCSAPFAIRRIPGLKAGEEYIDFGFTCLCSTPNRNTFGAEADFYDDVLESNEGNNEAYGVYWCGFSATPVCSDFV